MIFITLAWEISKKVNANRSRSESPLKDKSSSSILVDVNWVGNLPHLQPLSLSEAAMASILASRWRSETLLDTWHDILPPHTTLLIPSRISLSKQPVHSGRMDKFYPLMLPSSGYNLITPWELILVHSFYQISSWKLNKTLQ